MIASKLPIVAGYAQLISERVASGWSCHLMTFMFPSLSGPEHIVIGNMKDQVTRVYSTFVTRVQRRPRSVPVDSLPMFVGSADLPVRKRTSSAKQIVRANGGLHFNGLMLVPPVSRLLTPVAQHFNENEDLYTGCGRLIQRVDVRPVTFDPARVTDYVLKSITNGRLSYDEAILILPRTRGELSGAALAA